MVRGEGVFPGGISGWEEALDGGRACGVLVGSVGSRVGELVGLPVGGGGTGVAGGGAIKEAMGEVANATQRVNGEGEELDVLGVEGGDDLEVSGVRRVAMEFGLGFLVVPVMCGSRIVWDTGVSRGWRGDNDVDS